MITNPSITTALECCESAWAIEPGDGLDTDECVRLDQHVSLVGRVLVECRAAGADDTLVDYRSRD